MPRATATVVRSSKKTATIQTVDTDLVRVRATRRGFYAVRQATPDGIVRNEIIRNVDDVFDMDTHDMKPASDAREDATIIKTANGEFELPTWVELASEKVTAPQGHTTTFGKSAGTKTDVI
jgi:hypothetical protein